MKASRYVVRLLAVPVVAAGMLYLSTPRAAGAESGESIFKQKCAMCHGVDGSADTGMGRMMKIRDLRSPEVQKMTDAQLEELIAKGKGRMPAFENSLSKQDIQTVVAHIRELAKKK
jgi:mono/diheme cytochrome c family protein